jgi:hypothetical protein
MVAFTGSYMIRSRPSQTHYLGGSRNGVIHDTRIHTLYYYITELVNPTYHFLHLPRKLLNKLYAFSDHVGIGVARLRLVDRRQPLQRSLLN